MSATFNAREVAQLALRRIRAFSINDSAADPVELNVALEYLDMVISFITETNRINWLIDATIEVDLDADTASYLLSTLLGASEPTEGVVFTRGGWLDDGNGVESPLTQLRRDQYEAIQQKTASGTPKNFYVDRTGTPTISFYPVPAVATFNARIMVQKATNDMRTTQGAASGNIAHGFSDAWQLCLEQFTASHIGDGPVRSIPEAKTGKWEKGAQRMLDKLITYQNRETHGRARRVQAWGA
jgi:hypothetical protein